MGLEIPTAKVPGTQVRVTPAVRPPIVGLMIVLLTLLQFVFAYLIFDAVFIRGANSPTITTPAVLEAPLGTWFASDQRIISMWLGALFFNLSFIILLYQRFFIDHVTVAKRRYRKWEDEGVQHG